MIALELMIKLAEINDLEVINEIYNYYVLNSTASYQTLPESLMDRKEWFEKHDLNYPIFLAIYHDQIVGWASLSKYNVRQAYFPTVEDSIYIHHEFRFKGIGSLLMEKIIEAAQNLKYHSIIAGISADQTASIALHQKFGFQKVAHLKEVGYKFNKWLDIIYMQKMLN